MKYYASLQLKAHMRNLGNEQVELFWNSLYHHFFSRVIDRALSIDAEGPGFKSRLGHQWNYIKIHKILFLNEDTLAIVKSEASQYQSANYWLHSP